eukprot:7286038-Lingulodinium_polyedra.AAC.1
MSHLRTQSTRHLTHHSNRSFCLNQQWIRRNRRNPALSFSCAVPLDAGFLGGLFRLPSAAPAPQCDTREEWP